MGALVDRCPDCGKFVGKDAVICPHCEAELPETVAPAEPDPEPALAAPVPSRSGELARVLGGMIFGALLTVVALTAGAGDVVTLPDEPGTAPASEEAAPAQGRAAVSDGPTGTSEPQAPQTASVEAKASHCSECESGLSPERRSQLRSAIAAVRAELSDWPELYQITRTDLAEVERRLDELTALIEEIPSRKE